MTTPQHLYSMPVNLDTWAHVSAGLTPHEEGSLWRASRLAWTAQHRGAPPVSLPADEASLSRLLGDRAAIAVVRRFFSPHPENAQILTWEWLTREWETAIGRYQAKSKGGRQSAEKNRERSQGRKRRADRGGAKHPAQHSTESVLSTVQPEPYCTKYSTGGASQTLAAAGAASAPTPLEPLPPSRELVELNEAHAWLAEQPPETAAALERDVDARLLAERPKGSRLAIDSPFFAGIRARRLEELTVSAYVRSRISLVTGGQARAAPPRGHLPHSTREVPCANPPPSTDPPPALCEMSAGDGAPHPLPIA